MRAEVAHSDQLLRPHPGSLLPQFTNGTHITGTHSFLPSPPLRDSGMTASPAGIHEQKVSLAILHMERSD